MKQAFRKLRMKKVEGILSTPQQVEALRQSLEEATRDSYAQIEQARRRAWQRAPYIILD